MAQTRERDSISPSTGQSKRSSNALDTDSLDSDQTQHASQQPQPQQQQQQQQQHHRKYQTKHHVAAGRLHARAPSSKALNKHAHNNSSSKLVRRLTSPSPDRGSTISATALTFPDPPNHRRHHSSDVRLSRDHSATNLKKNVSQTSLKRNKSHADVGKRSKSAANLKRVSSEKAINKVKPSKSAVHFDLGNDGQNDEDADDWVDASSSASPYLSRRGSVNASGQSSANAQGSPTPLGGKGAGKATAVENDTDGDDGDDDDDATPLAQPTQPLFDDNKVHSRNLTSKLLLRTPSHSATTSMSSTVAMAKAASPDSRHSASTLSVTPATVEPQGMVGSNGTVEVTSRFITSQNTGGSFFATTGDMRPDKRPVSVGSLPGRAETGLSTATTKIGDDDEDDLTDEEDTGIASAIATTARSRRPGIPATAVSVDKSRTQQKINLQRASSSMEPVRHRHSGIGGFAAEVAEVAGPLLGGAGYDAQDPRVNKLLERTGVEYNIVRRYQNPVARSLARIAQLPGSDKARRIPRGAPSSRHSAQSFGGLSQSFHETNGKAPSRPATPKRAHTSIKHCATGSSPDTDDGGAAGRMHEGLGDAAHRLSGASLVNGEEDEGIQAILRGMWDKNLAVLASSAD